MSSSARRFVEGTYDWPAITRTMLRAYGIPADDATDVARAVA